MSFNDELEAARVAAERHEVQLREAYVSSLRGAGRTAAERFSARATLVASAHANWEPPDLNDVMAFAARTDRIRAQQRNMLATMAGVLSEIPGVGFDVLFAPAQALLDKMGLRAAAISAGIRGPVADAIARGWAEGRSVPQTAALIRSMVNELTPARAVMLARTDLISLSNGAGHMAVGQLNEAAVEEGEDKPFKSKTWASAGDSRVRPTHQDADGQTVPIDQPFMVGGVELMYPGDPDGPDEEVIQCRCVELFNEEAAGTEAVAASGHPNVEVPSEDRQEVRMSVTENENAAPVAVKWVSDIAFEGLSTGDGRFMAPDSLGWRDPPLTLMAMIETPEFGGHAGAQVAGRMDAFAKDAVADMDGKALAEGVVAVRSVGEFDLNGDRGSDTARMVEDETMRGISVDLAVNEWAFRDPDTGEMIDPDEMSDEQWERAFMGEYEFAVTDGTIMAATVCPTPAFADARIAVMADSFIGNRHVWRASAHAAETLGVSRGQLMTTLVATLQVSEEEAPLVAAAAPIAPPLAWFNRPEADGPTPITITDEGAIFGHIALWDTCHTGYVNGAFAQCVRAPRSQTSYAHFHVGEMLTAEGELVPIGKLTYDTGHAPVNLGRVAARSHYDESGSVGAYVRAVDGKHGIWISGTVRSDISREGLRDLRACPPSGDWRAVDHNLELVAALAVVTPGFPVPRSQLALAASADGSIEVTTLILSGMVAAADCADCDASEDDGARAEHEGAALAAVIEGGAEGLHALIEA